MILGHPQKSVDLTPERMFASKYAWLLRWALHFVQNDRAAAEDLVQDTFVRILLSWDTLRNLDDLEPLLYSYLKYAHLDEQRRRRSYAFQSLSTVDSEALEISLKTSTLFEQIGIQNELRSILAFLLWRRRSAKFASIFLLRFFHGFFPEEIAAICLVSRHSVDLSLRYARAELKTYLLDSSRLQIPGRGRIPEFQFAKISVPAHEFVDDLRRQIFNGPREVCPSADELERRYNSFPRRSLDCDLLAHIVVCETCLERVTGNAGAPPPSARSVEDSFASARRSKVHQQGVPSKARLARVFAYGKRWLREIFEHRLGVASGFAIAVSIIVAVGLFAWMRMNQVQEQVHFHDSIENSVRAEAYIRKERGSGVVHQHLLIRTEGKTVQRDIYRDIEGRRRAKGDAPDRDEQILRAKLAEAGLDWSDPLSATRFKRWHDRLTHSSDRVQHVASSNLLVLTTTTGSGGVRSGSLTVRSDDFHPVALTLVLEDRQSIEVAELSYSTEPWNSINDSWFEPLVQPISRIKPHDTREPLPAPSSISESQIDLAWLSAFAAIQELHAEAERVEIFRDQDGVRVKGVVESEDRKQQIVARLRTIPHLIPDIVSYRELDQKPGLSSPIDAVATISVISEDSQLDKYCTAAQISRDECRQLAYRLLNSSAALARGSLRVKELKQQYPTGKSLSAGARELLIELVRGYMEHLSAALSDQQAAINMMGPPPCL